MISANALSVEPRRVEGDGHVMATCGIYAAALLYGRQRVPTNSSSPVTVEAGESPAAWVQVYFLAGM